MSGRQRVISPVQGLAAAAVFGLALTLTGTAFAQTNEAPPPDEPAATAAPVNPPPAAPPAIPQRVSAPAVAVAVPDDPVARAAFEVLDKHCARCHQEGALSARERPAKNFGNVLKLDEIAANPHYILPGNPFGSKLFKQIVDKEMPYDVEYEGETKYPSMTPDELKALEIWITQLGTRSAAACDARKFVSNEDMLNAVVNDLSRLPNARKKGTRYLTLTHLKNACMDDIAMKVYRQGAVKLVNSLSRSSDVVRLETIDPDESIIRINLDDIGWEAKDWDDILAVYPYNLQPESDLKAVLTNASGTQLPYVRADWFAFTASQPPLYDKLLKLPNTFPEVAKQEGVDIDGNIKRFLAQRSGFQRSGVSQNNRMIERHPSRAGYFWTSYDFGGNRGKQSFFEHPLGPKGADGFEHDGGESIWSLPNGFQAYYLNTADGKRLDKGPTQIVRDLSRKDLTVTNGISCMGCHDQGIRKAKDEVRQVVLSGKSFNKQTREAVEALYIPSEKMDAILESDTKKFQDAMFRAGLEPSLKLNGVEMINALAKRYEDDLDLTLAAAEFGFSKKDFDDAADDADRKFRPLIRRLQQGSIPRDQFENNYRELAVAITDQEAVPGTGGSAPSSGSPAAGAAAGGAVATPVSNEALSLTSDKNAYQVGDTPVFTVLAKKSCFLTLVNLDDKGTATVLLPNKFQQNNQVKAGQVIQFPGQKAPFQFRMQDKGFEQVIATCSESADVDGIKNDFAKNTLTTVPNFTRTVAGAVQADAKKKGTRAIAVEGTKAAGVPTTPQNAKAVPADKRDVARAAIKVEVK